MPLPAVVAMQTRQPNLEGAGEIPLRRLVRGTGYPPHPERFAAHGFDLPALLDDARWRT